MRAKRRQSILRFAERAALALAVCDLLFYFFVARPVHARLSAAQEGYDKVRLEIGQRETRVARLERIKAQLPQANDELKAFLHDHVPARRWCFSTSDRMVRNMAGQAHVQLSAVRSKLAKSKNEPLERLTLNIVTDGPFENVMNFAHAVEASDNLMVLRNFSLVADEGDTITLTVGADLYLTR